MVHAFFKNVELIIENVVVSLSKSNEDNGWREEDYYYYTSNSPVVIIKELEARASSGGAGPRGDTSLAGIILEDI
jgi:hypothetical protein